MAVTEQRNLFNPKIEALAEQYASAMGAKAAQPFTAAQITSMAPQVAPQTGLQQQATGLTTAGLGAYSPYVQAAGQDLTAAGTQLGTAEQGLAGIGAAYASPAVAGIAAIIRGYYPKLSAGQVKQIIMDSGISTKATVVLGGDTSNTKKFQTISTSGKMANLYNALILADQISKNN